MQHRPGGEPVLSLRSQGWRPGCAIAASGGRVLLKRGSSKSANAWDCLTLPLFVPQVVADHHDPAVSADHLAFIADFLDAGLDLHRPAVCSIWMGDKCWGLPVPEDDPAFGEVIRAELHDHSILGENSNIVLSHFS